MQILKIALIILALIIITPIILFLSIIYKEYKPEYNRVIKVQNTLHEHLGCDVKTSKAENNGIQIKFTECIENSLLSKKGIQNNDIILVHDPILNKYPATRFRYYGNSATNYTTQPPTKHVHAQDSGEFTSYYFNLILAYEGKNLELPIEQNSIQKIINIKIPDLPLTKEEAALIDPTWKTFLHP